jgi:sulfite reductase (NADPH) flavoprotein alpha-component
MLRKFCSQAHWIVGISAGIVLAIVGITGATMSFEDEIQNWLNQDARRVSRAAAAPLSPAALLAAFEQRHAGERITALQLSGDPQNTVRVTFGNRQTRYVDPHSGAEMPREGTRGRQFFQITRSMHRWLTAGSVGKREIGEHVVAISVLLCTGLVLSGLYLRWPRGRNRNWRLWLAFNPRLKGRSFLWNLHAVLGTWVLAIFLIMSLTGPYWSYDWYRNGLYAIASVERPPQRRERPARSGTKAPPQPTANITAAWRSFQAMPETQGFHTATVNLPRDEKSPIEIRYIDGNPSHSRASNTVKLNALTGAVLDHERYDDKRIGEKFIASMLALHTGSFFGLPGRGAFMLAALCMPVFTITGWMMYLQGRRRKRAPR